MELEPEAGDVDRDTELEGDENEDEDDEVFEIVDYTAVSPWERFISAIEHAIHSWKVGDGSLGFLGEPADGPRSKKEVVHLGDTPYLLTYHACSESTPNVEVAEPIRDALRDYRTDFPASGPAGQLGKPAPHPLHRQTGLSHFLVISAFDSEPTFDLSTNKLLMSSLSVALHNSGSTLAAFAPIGVPRRGLYTGIMLVKPTGGNYGDLEIAFRSHVDVRAIKVSNTGDMLAIAEARLELDEEDDSVLAAARKSTRISACYSYRLSVGHAPSPEGVPSRSLPPLHIGNVAGTTLRHVQLDAYHPSISPDLDPEEPDPSAAPLWLISREWRPGPPQLTELLDHLNAEWTSWKRRQDSGRRTGLIGALMDDSPGGPAIVETADIHSTAVALFSWSAYEARGSRWSPHAESKPNSNKPSSSLDALLPRLASGATVPPDSFLWHLAHRLLDCASPSTSLTYRHTSVSSFLKAVWAEVLVALEQCLEQGAAVPGVNWSGSSDSDPGPSIDLRRALLHQKLSMLNCCIRERNKRVGQLDARRASTVLVPAPDPSSPTPGGWRRERSTSDESGSEPEEKPTVWRSGLGLRERGKKLLGFERREETGSGAWGDLLSTVEKNTKKEKGEANDGWSGDEAEGDVFYEADAEGQDMPASPEFSGSEDVAQQADYGTSFRSDSFIEVDRSAPKRSSLIVDEDAEHVEGELLDDDERSGASELWRDAGGNPIKLLAGGSFYIPEVQEHGHMTEDMVQSLEERLQNLGHGHEAAKARAEMQTAQLRSDMEAFKAANPHAVLEDFVRWHSPRDCTEITDDSGDVVGIQLSSRMLEPGNLWQSLWRKARRIPAVSQTPLFDFEGEAKKVMSDLWNLTPFDILNQLLPTIFLIVYDSLATHESARQIPPIAQAADQLAKLISGMPWDDIRWGELDEVTDRLDKAVAAARELEELVSRANDLLAQLPLQYGIVERLLEAGETVVNDGPEREAAWDLFGAGELLDNPSSREYVLKMTAPRNRSETEATLQRFWFQLRDGEVRVVECLSRRD